MDYGEVLVQYRARHNLSQRQLGEIIGIKQERVCKYESGKHIPTKKNRIIQENKMKEWEEKKSV